MAMSPRLLRPRATGFNPRQLSGLLLWMDATDTSTTTIDTGVSVWRDKSGLGQQFGQTTGLNQPALVESGIGGKRSLSFTASSSHAMTGAFSHTLTAATAFVVATMESTTVSSGRLFGLSVGASGNDTTGTGHLSPLLRFGTGANVASYHQDGFRGTRGITYGSGFIFSMTHTGSLLSNRINNGTVASYTHTSSWTASMSTMMLSTQLTTANAAGNGTFTGLMSEIIFYNRALSDSERLTVHQYLSKKYGITLS